MGIYIHAYRGMCYRYLKQNPRHVKESQFISVSLDSHNSALHLNKETLNKLQFVSFKITLKTTINKKISKTTSKTETNLPTLTSD